MNLHLDRLDEAAAVIRPKLLAFHQRARAAGYALLLVRCYDTPAAQFLKYQQGRTYDREMGQWTIAEPDKIITHARPGRSAHNVVTADGRPAALAADFIPVDPLGRPIWAAPPSVWQTLYRVAAHCGLDSYGDGWGAELAGDPGHWQEPGFDDPCYCDVLSVLGLRRPTEAEVQQALTQL